jgi:hypothetical protein
LRRYKNDLSSSLDRDYQTSNFAHTLPTVQLFTFIMPSGLDISRIKDHPDKRLLKYVQRYYKTFTDPNPEQMWAYQTKDFKITDIRMDISLPFCLDSPLTFAPAQPSVSSRLTATSGTTSTKTLSN